MWINDPPAFYEDGSYCTSEYPQVGDIICYIAGDGTNLHSGIVTEVIFGPSQSLCGYSDLATVESKWGPYGLYQHNGYRCQYTEYGRENDSQELAVTVEFHRPAHSYDTYTSNGSSGHAATCSECGYVADQTHTYTYTYISSNLFTHTARCSKCSYSCSESHTWYSSPTNYRCTKCRLVTVAIPVLSADLPPALLLSLQQLGTDAAIAMDENTFLCQVDGQYYMVKGTTAEQALQTVLPQVNEAA